MNMTGNGIILSLAISTSLASGYLAGRLHAEFSQSPMTSSTASRGSADIASLSEPGSDAALRPSLNPKPIRPSVPARGRNEVRSITFQRYGTPTKAVAESAQDDLYPPRHIGEFKDPDALIPPGELSKPQNIGRFIDPDESYWMGDDDAQNISIGEFIDPADQIQDT